MTIWTDPGRCSTCKFCSMDMNMEPFCVHPIVLKDYKWGLYINSAIKYYCGQDLSLREEG